ncbi:MAG: TRAP transporter substrate-binding protein [Sphaerochaetaceae bacterium]
MKKFSLVLAFLMIAGILFAAGGGEAGSQKPVTLRVGGIQTTEDPSTKALYKMAEIAKERSNGTLILQIFPASQLGNATNQIEAVTMGSQEMFVDAGWMGTFLQDKTIDAMWFIFEDANHYKNYINSELNKQFEEEFRKLKNIRIIASNWYRAPRSFSTKKPIKSTEDFKDLIIRIPDLTGYVESVSAIGAKSTQVAWGETYLALKQGVVDAAEGPIDNLYSMNFYEAGKFITVTNHLRDSMQVMINDKKFDSLSAEHQKILVDASLEAGDWYSAQINEVIEQSIQNMKQNGATVTPMDPDVLSDVRDMLIRRIESLDASGKWWKSGLYAQISDLAK